MGKVDGASEEEKWGRLSSQALVEKRGQTTLQKLRKQYHYKTKKPLMPSMALEAFFHSGNDFP
jgi:hypothetical protein